MKAQADPKVQGRIQNNFSSEKKKLKTESSAEILKEFSRQLANARHGCGM